MSGKIPDKQWAQVIEKTGGPVEYKQIPGKTEANPLSVNDQTPYCYLRAPTPLQIKSSSTSNTPESATPTSTPSMATGPSPLNSPS